MQSLWMIVASFFFACMGVCVKMASEQYSAAEIVFYRSFLNFLFAWGVLIGSGVPIRTPYWKLHIRRSAAGCLSLFLFFYTISMLPLATAVTLSYTSPLFLAIFLVIFGKTHLRGGMVFALILGFVGVILLLHPTFRADQLLGGFLGLASGMVTGVSFFNIKELGERGEPEGRIVFYLALVCTLVSGVWMLFFEFHPISLKGGALLLGVGLFGTAGQLMLTRAYKRGNALMTASLAYSTVVFASLFGALFWDELLSVDAWLAIAVIMASGVVATWFSRANPAKQD